MVRRIQFQTSGSGPVARWAAAVVGSVVGGLVLAVFLVYVLPVLFAVLLGILAAGLVLGGIGAVFLWWQGRKLRRQLGDAINRMQDGFNQPGEFGRAESTARTTGRKHVDAHVRDTRGPDARDHDASNRED